MLFHLTPNRQVTEASINKLQNKQTFSLVFKISSVLIDSLSELVLILSHISLSGSLLKWRSDRNELNEVLHGLSCLSCLILHCDTATEGKFRIASYFRLKEVLGFNCQGQTLNPDKLCISNISKTVAYEIERWCLIRIISKAS